MSARRLVLTDTNILLNFAQIDRLDLLAAFSDLELCSPPEVLAEVIRERERTLVEEALNRGQLHKVFLDVESLPLFTELSRIMGSGEAACLALAVRKQAWVASDEKRAFRREAEQRLGAGRIFNTPGLLLLGIRRGLLTVDEADDMKSLLEKRRFKMSFGSFRDLLG